MTDTKLFTEKYRGKHKVILQGNSPIFCQPFVLRNGGLCADAQHHFWCSWRSDSDMQTSVLSFLYQLISIHSGWIKMKLY